MQAQQSKTTIPARHIQHVRRAKGQVMVTRLGLEMPPLLSYEKWQEAGLRIARIVDSSAWCLGDWLVYGQEMYSDRYQMAIEAAGLDYQTLRNYAWVARRFELSRRRESLSLQHHAELARLPVEEQDHWLDRAESGRWSRNQLRRELRVGQGTPDDAEADEAALPRITVGQERLEHWVRAAEAAGVRLEPWLISSLDRAAIDVLGEPG
jgi:hypothetical protein